MQKVTQQKAKSGYVSIRDLLTVYVWGFNFDTTITRESIAEAYKRYASSKYDKKYYENKLKEGEGRPGSDCSGAHHKLSGYDTTAQGYFDKCTAKGPLRTIPRDRVVLLFKGKSLKNLPVKADGTYLPEDAKKINDISHTGAYIGNCMAIHMKSSKENCVYESVDKHGWYYWGYADFIDYDTVLKKTKPMLTRIIKMGYTGIDVKFAQDMLNNKGYDCGRVDGDFGKKTKEAVKKFQEDCKITADGIIGKDTGKRLGFNIRYFDNPWSPNG